MAFWRRRPTPARSEPEASRPTPSEPEPGSPTAIEPELPDAEADLGERQPLPPPEEPLPASGTPESRDEPPPTPGEPVSLPDEDGSPAYAPFDPTAFLAVAPAHTLDQGLERTRGSFVAQLRGYLGGVDGPAWDEVEETLIAGDVGAALAIDLVARARRRANPDGPEAAVRAELAALLVARDLDWVPRPAASGGPAIVLVVGVNGTGKTTTIGKLAARYVGEGRTVIIAAADTFRAAAIDQLRIWADRAGVPVVAHAPGADPGAVVYDAIDAAIARAADIVIADTAGRLHTKVNLMDELTKVRRIVDKRLPGATPETLFVLDATTGQNGLAQAKAFHDAVGLSGIVLTKLDSSSKGGIVFAIEDGLHVPVRFVGVGEGVNDLLPFDPDAFVEALFA
ncbi:MAG TPA: signal recognition particle-docking protein FtsY [Candidatus Limnocylindrales bacterium]|nr:signal recognition particle-docking protein FtsY [Candidatus Limnocylindrales bacterium]